MSTGHSQNDQIEGLHLLEWYDRVRRDLPWRRRSDPWAVWVSEVMLQQTQVERVVPHYLRFLERFPDVGSCAKAELEDVLAAWAGLGYYRRASRLHAGAQQVRRLGAPQVWPTTAAAWRGVVGVGAYTAAAIASIAFSEHVAAVDTNVARVIARWVGFSGPQHSGNLALIGREALRLVGGPRPGDVNQALMELGATVCGVRLAKCEICPLRHSCRGAAEPTAYGLAREKLVRRAVVWVVVVVDCGEDVLARRRPESEELLGGTWELPWAEMGSHQTPAEALSGKYEGAWRLGREIGSVKHAIASRSILLRVFEGETDSPPRGFEGRHRAFLATAATANVFRKCLKVLESRRV